VNTGQQPIAKPGLAYEADTGITSTGKIRSECSRRKEMKKMTCGGSCCVIDYAHGTQI